MIKGALPFLFLISGCASIDTGEIDYRRAENPGAFNTAIADYPTNGCRPKAKDAAGNLDQCGPLFPARLFRKYATVGDPIPRNGVYSIRLEQGLINFMTEAKFSTRRLAGLKNPFRKVGEIVVLAQTFEFAASAEAATTQKARFVDLTTLNDVKVIYYSPDVEEGQTLNFSNIPLQPPTVYGGNPVGIQIVVLELDRMSTPLKSLMKELAGLGAASGVLPAGPASKILLDLGTSMLTQDNDDVIFDYRFVLDPVDGSSSVGSAPFESGRYVMRRADNRRGDAIWRNLLLDHNTGRLMVRADAGQRQEVSDAGEESGEVDSTIPYVEFHGDTWFTINVIKHPAGTTASFYDFKTLEQLGTEIQTAADRRDQPFATVAGNIRTMAETLRSGTWRKDVGEAAEAAVSSYRIYGRQISSKATPDATCTVSADAAAKESKAQFEAASSIAAFIDVYKRALADVDTTKAPVAPVFSESDQRSALSIFGAYFAPFSHAGTLTQAHLLAPDTFKTAFVDPGSAPLIAAMDTLAQDQLAVTDCTGLVANGLATSTQPAAAIPAK